MFNSAACLLANRAGLCTNTCLTLSIFSGVLAFFSGPGCFFFIILPVARKFFTHRRFVLWLGTTPWWPMLKCHQKSRWVIKTDSPLLTNVSYTNTQCSTGQVSIATEVANTEEKNAKHLFPFTLGLPTEYYPFKRCQVPVGHPVVPPPSHNIVGVWNQITLLILYYISSRLVTILKVTDVPIQVPSIFYLTVSFKFLNFSFQSQMT